ncbi:hypothetical protein GLOTRDRAFT_91023 [Gloeophyllum trabeum ATCC 11539]|uniref:BTB domain-containing protein n=1 Tax=Gloeophyllum trabeum (strain ATCC 11539 / FP-39264 / Madison 617) TaxID=670483 RepID=S7QI34_GLOTA|nr:uncharacterized protein GLOTRDRAFT_91023 [Gloeophyllum trabeum ATCC 11539]EPQ59426.1 hypothetical protein GLOTRDRAFT_91023 [Gloeophyllum trabeum ATCC 11539]
MPRDDNNDAYYHPSSVHYPSPPSRSSSDSSASIRSTRTSKSLSPSRRPTKSPVTPPKTPPRIRRPSIAALPNPMNWLARSSSSNSTPQAAPYGTSVKPIRISEPKLNNSLELWAGPRSGTLGSGATVVRTPQEALIGSSARVSYGSRSSSDVDSLGKKKRVKSSESIDELYENAEEAKESPELPSPPESPPLPPLPLFAATKSTPELPLRSSPAASSTSLPPPPPTRPPPSPPTRPALKNCRTSSSPPNSAYFPPVPVVPAHLATPSPQPAFEAILVSAVPSAVIDPTKVIVTLETNTVTYRTSYNTLVSQSSHLASYLKSLMSKGGEEDEEDDGQSMRSFASEAESSFNSIFHHHLASSGLLSQSTSNIHVFLDRPSASYAHILTYLRTPTALPRSVQLSGCSSRTEASARLDALLDLRDEAAYLGLDDLQKLCTEEIRSKYTLSHAGSPSHAHTLSVAGSDVPPKHQRGGSTTSLHSMQTLRETPMEEEEIAPRSRRDRSASRERVAESTATTATVPGLRDRLARSTSSNSALSDGLKSPGISMSMRTRPAANWI